MSSSSECSYCKGKGYVTCKECKGSGVSKKWGVQPQCGVEDAGIKAGLNIVRKVQACEKCNGQGRGITCNNCNGTGYES